MSAASMKLEARGLSKRYGNRTVVHDATLEVERGQAVGLLGPNGAGKTTTFYMIVGLTRPDTGAITMAGEDLAPLPIHARARRGLGYLPQESSVFRKLSVEENLNLVLDNLELSRQERRSRAEAVMEDLSIRHLARSKAMTLSGGERRRLEIARALVLDPQFLLLDEPYAGIDPISVEEIQGILKRLKERGIGIVITDHNVRETLSSCDVAYLIKDGRIWTKGTPEEVVANEAVRRFYLGENFRL
jgi:lipopolysaccharide export system ATP-binding protein